MYASDFQNAAAGVNQLSDAAARTQQNLRDIEQHRLEDTSRQANAAQATGEATAMNGGQPLETPAPAAPGVLGTIENAAGSLKDHVENFFSKLMGHGSKAAAGPPNSSPAPSSPDANAAPAGTPPAGAVPSPAAAQAPAGASSPAVPPAAAIVSNPKQAGVAAAATADPQTAPHSMTHVDWHELDRLQLNAKRAALLAGKDPEAVGKAMNDMRTSFIQSGMLKYAAVANTALMNGDQKGLETAMRNMNYFLPNGQDLELYHDPKTGNLQYVDPFDPKTADGKPNYIDVTPQHIQLLAENLTDPLKVQDTINAAVLQKAKIAHEQAQDKALQTTAQAALVKAGGYATNAATHRALAPGQDELNRARAKALLTNSNANAARAAAASKGAVTPQVAQAAANAASTAADNAAQGIMETNTDEASLQYGKPMRNNAKIPDWYKGADGKKMGPGDLAGSAAFAGKIGAANVGTMSAAEAAEIGGQIYHKQHVKMTTHKGPDGKPVNDVQAFPATNQLGLWVPDAKGSGGHYRYVNAYPQLIDEMQNGVDQGAAYNNIYAPAEGGGPEDDKDENPADNAPAIPKQE